MPKQSARRPAPTPKYTRTDFVSKVGRGGSARPAPSGTTKPNIPTPIETGHKRS